MNYEVYFSQETCSRLRESLPNSGTLVYMKCTSSRVSEHLNTSKIYDVIRLSTWDTNLNLILIRSNYNRIKKNLIKKMVLKLLISY